MAENLLSKISAKPALINAWKKINKQNPESRGLSGESISDFEKNLDSRITSINSRLISKSYKFSPTKAVVIPKSNGKFRPLQVPEIEDRVVLKAMALEIEEQFSSVLKESEGISFAYQKGLGVRDAIGKLSEYYKSGKKVILEADIINFFGEVNKEKLLESHVFPFLSDPSLNELLVLGLSQKIGGLDLLSKEHSALFKDLDNGIPQGNSLSPLLSNIYLSPFDKFMKAHDYGLIRYADDFIVMCSSESEAEECYRICKEYLEKHLKLKIYSIEVRSKTKILSPEKERFSFLSIEFDGTDFFPSREKFEEFKDKIRGLCNSNNNKTDVLMVLTKVRNALDGWLSAYFYTKVDRYIVELDYYINRQLFLVLRTFDWKLSSATIEKVPSKFAIPKQSRDCISQKQRNNSGIPFCKELLVKKRGQKNISEETEEILGFQI